MNEDIFLDDWIEYLLHFENEGKILNLKFEVDWTSNSVYGYFNPSTPISYISFSFISNTSINFNKIAKG